MAVAHLFQFRFDLAADLLCVSAAGLKGTARRRVDGRRHVALEHNPPALSGLYGIRHGNRGNQGLGVGMKHIPKQLIHLGVFLHQIEYLSCLTFDADHHH